MKLLFITRKYPPSIGGMEKVNYILSQELSEVVDTTIIFWGKSQKYLPLFMVYFFFKASYLIWRKKITNVHLGDALLSPLGLLLKKLFHVKCSVTVHGLDITYKLPIYQWIVPKCVSKLDKIICISKATLNECVPRGIPVEKCSVITWGVYPREFYTNANRADLEKIVGQTLTNKKVMVTVGRLVQRKGVYWFIKNVMPKFDNSYIYVVIGDGEQREAILNLINELDLSKQVLLLGKVTDDALKIIYNTADTFVMPNIKVDGDIEGFGIVALEAMSAGLPVIAANIEGIPDVGVNLVESGDSNGFYEACIRSASKIPKQEIIKLIENNFQWKAIVNQYVEIF